MSIKINKLEIENVKRVKAVKIEPTRSGLTVIGGNNDQGKTSVLDALAWLRGGGKYKPTSAQRDGSVTPPSLQATLSNGLIVERKGKNATLTVTDPSGQKAGQQLLDSFVSTFALDLPKFMDQTPKEKADTLLRIIGVEGALIELNRKEAELYNQRRTIGQIADQKKKFSEEQPYFTDAPKEPIAISEMIQQQQEVLARNGENQKKRMKMSENKERAARMNDQIARLENDLKMAKDQWKALDDDIKTGEKNVSQLQDESTAELESNIRNVESINIKVRANLTKDKAEEDAKDYAQQYEVLSTKLDEARKNKTDLLKNADLPLPDLSVEDGELIYKGKTWTDMSGSQQLKVATAIVRKLNPECGFVLLDKLEQLDQKTLTEFGTWLEAEDLQAIATRVSTGSECQIIIEDGYAIKNETLTQDTDPVVADKPSWAPGKY